MPQLHLGLTPMMEQGCSSITYGFQMTALTGLIKAKEAEQQPIRPLRQMCQRRLIFGFMKTGVAQKLFCSGR
jgi:hypothetical protein